MDKIPLLIHEEEPKMNLYSSIENISAYISLPQDRNIPQLIVDSPEGNGFLKTKPQVDKSQKNRKRNRYEHVPSKVGEYRQKIREQTIQSRRPCPPSPFTLHRQSVLSSTAEIDQDFYREQYETMSRELLEAKTELNVLHMQLRDNKRNTFITPNRNRYQHNIHKLTPSLQTSVFHRHFSICTDYESDLDDLSDLELCENTVPLFTCSSRKALRNNDNNPNEIAHLMDSDSSSLPNITGNTTRIKSVLRDVMNWIKKPNDTTRNSKWFKHLRNRRSRNKIHPQNLLLSNLHGASLTISPELSNPHAIADSSSSRILIGSPRNNKKMKLTDSFASSMVLTPPRRSAYKRENHVSFQVNDKLTITRNKLESVGDSSEGGFDVDLVLSLKKYADDIMEKSRALKSLIEKAQTQIPSQ